MLGYGLPSIARVDRYPEVPGRAAQREMFAGVVDVERVPIDKVIRITLWQPTAQHEALTTIARARHYHSALEWDSTLIALRRNEPRHVGLPRMHGDCEAKARWLWLDLLHGFAMYCLVTASTYRRTLVPPYRLPLTPSAVPPFDSPPPPST